MGYKDTGSTMALLRKIVNLLKYHRWTDCQHSWFPWTWPHQSSVEKDWKCSKCGVESY
jgi:hypothetical protein